MTFSSRVESARERARRHVRRRRRPLAAALAALAMLAALASLRPAPTPTEPGTARAAALATGEVAVPVTLAGAAVARSLSIGGRIDLVAVSAEQRPAYVAHDARVLTLPDAGNAFTPSGTAVITVALPEDEALDVIAANAQSALAVVLRDLS